jgi:hypothetical protein
MAEHASRHKKEGAFYTPVFIMRYIVGQKLLHRHCENHFETLHVY